MIRHIDGGRERFLDLVYLAASGGDADAVVWWTCFASLKAVEQQRVSFDDVCAASGAPAARIAAAIVSTAIEHAAQVADLIAAATHPTIVHQMAKSAKRIGGKHAAVAQRDRFALLQHNRFLPVPKNTVVDVHVAASANANAAAAASADPSVPGFLDDIDTLRSANDVVQGELMAATTPDES